MSFVMGLAVGVVLSVVIGMIRAGMATGEPFTQKELEAAERPE